MKLHLPTRLRAAVLACITAVAALASTVGTGALTTGVVAYTLAASQANAAYNPGSHTFEGADNTNFGSNLPSDPTDITFNMENTGTSNWSNGFTYAGNVLIGEDGVTDKGLCLNNGNAGQVLTLSGKVTGTGLISKKGAGMNNTLALTGDVTEFKGDYVLDSTVGFTLRFGSGGEAPATTAETGIGGTGNITFKTGNNTLAYNYGADSTVHITNAIVREGDITSKVSFAGGANYVVHKDADISELTVNGGILTFSGSTVLGNVTGDASGILGNGNGGALTLNGTISLYAAIMNSGSVTLGENVKFDLSHLTAAEGVYTIFDGTAVDLSSLTAENLLGTQAGYAYTFNADGTVTATATCQNLTWTGGLLTWEVGATIGEGTFANGDIVNFTTAGADVTLGGDVTSGQVNIASGVDVTLSGAHTLTTDEININGTLVLADAVLNASALKLAGNLEIRSADNLASGTTVTHVGNAAKVTVAGTELLINGILNGYNGTLVVEDGATVKMGSSSALGAVANSLIVNAGGVLDVNGKPDHGYTVTLNGGSLVNTGDGVGTGKKQFAGLNLTANSEIGGTGQFGVIGGGYAATTVNLNGHTLTKTGTNVVDFANATVTAGTLRIEGGSVNMFQNSCKLNCDLVLAGGSLTGAASAMSGDHTISSEGAGGTIGCNITSTGAVAVDTAAGSTLTVSGALTTEIFSKTGEGTLTMSGALTVNKQLDMNYAGSLTLGDVSVADGAVLTYSTGAADSVMSLAADALAGNVTVDIFSLTAEQLAAGINLGIAADAETSKLTIGGLSEDDYTIETKGDTLWLKATKAAESDWDKNWGGAALSAAPATLEQLTITEENNFLATKYADSSVIGVQLTASEAANNVFGGILNTDVTEAATTAKRVWIDVTGGTYGVIAGGNNCVAWQGSSVQNFEGDTHIQLKGGSVGNIIGGNFKDGFSPNFKGSSYISVMGGSEVTGNIIGGNTSAHSQTTNFTGDSHIFVYTMLSTNSSDLESLGNAWIIGGSAWIANTAGGTQNFAGNTNVTIDLSGYTGEAATFVKTVVGGNFTNASSSTVQSLSGDTHVTVKGTDDTTFSGWIIAGARSSSVGTNTQSGNAEMLIDGGHYTGNVVGGFYQNGNSTTTLSGTAALTIKGGSFSNDVRGGSHVSGGTATLGGVALTIEGGSFAKDVIAGMYNNVSNTHQVTVGDTTVTMSDGTVTGNLVGGSRLLTGDGLMTNGNISVEVSGGSVAANIIGGDYISGAGAASLNAGIGDIAVTVSGGSVKDIYGGSRSDRNYAAGTIAQGNVSVSLTGGTVTGDVYVGGYQGGSTKLTSESTTLEIGSGVTLTEGKTLSGGYKPYNDTFNLTATVTGSRTLKLTTDGAQDLSGMTVKDFDTVNVANAAGVVTIASLTQSKGTNAITKTGAGTLTLGADFTADSLTVSAGKVDIAAVTDLGGRLMLSNGGGLQTSTADTAMGVTGLTVNSGATIAITGAAEGYTSPIKLLSGLTEAAISGLTFNEEEGSKYADISGIITVSGVSSDYNRLLFSDGTLSLVSAAAPVADLIWNAGSGTWGGGDDHWTSEGEATEYVPGAHVTISGTEGGMIALSSPQKAKSVTIAHSGYTLANESQSDTLTITGDFTVKENVSTTLLNFVPTVGGNIVVKSGATLDMSAIDLSQNLLVTVGSKATGNGTVILKGNSGTDLRESVTFNTNVKVDGGLWLNGRDTNATVTVTEGNTLTLTGELSISRAAKVAVDGGTLDAQGGISLGHPDGNYPTTLSMSGGEIKTTGIMLQSNNANTIEITGGKLTVTNADAFTGSNDRTTVNISNATITNGETDMAFNHASTLTNATISAKNDKTITVGGTGLNTTLAGGITTEGKVTLDGTLDTTGLTGVSNSGDLTITADSVSLAGLNNTGTVTANNVTLTTATAKGGVLSAGDVTLTGANTFTKLTATGTVTSADTLTVGNGSEMNAVSAGTKLTTKGGVTIKSDTTLAALSNAGNTLTVEGALTLTGATTAGGTVSADALSLTGVNTFEAIATGALTIADSLKVTGALNATAVSITNVSTTTTALTAGSLTGGSLALTMDEQAIADAMGTSITSLTLANIAGLTDASINGKDSFTVGSRDYTINVTDGVVTITSDISDKIVWDGSNGDKWGSDSSWEGGNQPTAESNVVFNGTGDANVTIAGNAEAGNIFVESTANFTGSGNVSTTGAEISKGTLTIDENVSVAVADTTSVTSAGNIIIKGALGTDTLAAENKDVLLSGELAVDTEGSVNKIDGINGAYGTLIVGSDAEMMMLTLVADTLTIATDSTVDDLEIKNTGNLDAKGTFTVNNDADVAAGGVMTVAKELTITGELANAGNITVGSVSAPAKLTTGKVVNDGTITVFNDMTATDEVTNNATLTVNGDAELADLTTGTDSETAITGNADIDGALASNGTTNIGGSLDAASVTTESGTLTVGGDTTADALATAADTITNLQGGATIAETLTNAGTTTIEGALAAENADVQNDAGTLTVGGDTAAGTLATAEGATTDLQGATIGTSLTNAGTTTIAGALSAANADVQNDAGTLTVTGDTAAGMLATAAGATTNLLGRADIADTLTNEGATTISGKTTVGGDVSNSGNLSTGALAVTGTVTNGGTLNAEGNLTAASLKSTGATAATGNVTLGSLKLGSSGSLTAGGTVKTNAVESTGGSLTADTLDLSGLTAAAKLADVKADKITLGGFDMLTVTHSLSDEAGTGAAQVTLLLDDEDMSVLSIGDEKRIIGGTGAASGMGFTLANLDAVNDQLEAYGLKGAMVTNSAGLLVMQMQDNSFETQIGLTENGKVGAAMMDEASAAGLAVPGSAMADVYAALDACRDSGNAEAGDKLASALTGSSIAAMGSALSGDVERQLKAIRNRTTTMGVDQCVVNEDMPYFNAWVNAEGDYRKVAADGTLAGYKLMSWGGTVGMDIDCTPSFTCGLAATAMYGSFDGESEDHATGDLNTYYLSAFGRYAKHRWTHTFVATVGMADTSLERTILGHKVKGDSNGVMFGGLYEVGYVFALDREATTCLQPIFNVSFTHASLSGYDEEGANIGLTAGDVELNKLTVGLGARLQSVVGEDIYNRSSILEARALVKVDAGDRQGETSVAFAGSGLPTRSAKSSETGVVGAEFGIGLTVPVGSESGNLFLDASAEIRAEYTNANATVGYRINF